MSDTKEPLRRHSFGLLVTECAAPLGMKDGSIKDSAVAASSWYDHNTRPEKARLFWEWAIGNLYCAAWRARTNDDKQWLQVNLGKMMKITRIATQGGYYYNYYNYNYNYYWVTSYSLHDQEDFQEHNNMVRI